MTTLVSPVALPLTLKERETAPVVLRQKATFEEYVDFADQCEYPVQYVNGEIVSMSQASLPHEALVGYIITCFNLVVEDDNETIVFGSNIKIHVEATGESFNADVGIIRGKPDYLLLPSGRPSTVEITNPVLVVEVLSDSTQGFDLGEKLESYKQIPSLEQVLFVSQHQPWVWSYKRSETPDVWLNTSFHALADTATVLGKPVTLSPLYRKFAFA